MEFLGSNAARRAATFFAATIVAGAIFLTLPFSASAERIGIVNALFTSTSAVCVTGLTVVDTGRDFSLFGQIVILLLVQLGGIGLMTITSALLISLGGRLSLGDRYGLSSSFSAGESVPTVSLLKAIVSTVLIVESLGAVALFFRFNGEMPAGQAVYHAIFHSISAFCNAGFSVFSSSFRGYHDDPLTLLIIAALIIVGGVGFVVIREVGIKIRRWNVRLSLHSKLALTTTAVLLLFGAIGFFLAERNNAFAGGSLFVNLVNALFQSTTCRTAGFDSIPQASLTDISLVISVVLMFIGGCAGSTAGGIKTTTVAILGIVAFHRLRGLRSLRAFRSTISLESATKAMVLTVAAVTVVVMGSLALMMAADPPSTYAYSHGEFMECVFEVVSALGTVGLSMGITPHLGEAGKLILVALMFIGRVGLITLVIALATRPPAGEITYLEEDVMVG
jgi:trk system potassium uptake protein TrkH